jgi:electron transfer flavoprotein alpha subunit
VANVFAFAETRSGELRKVAYEAVTVARQIADTNSGEVHALLVGPAGIAAHAAKLSQRGADTVFVGEHAGFAHYNAEATADLAADRLRTGGYSAAIFSTSAQGRDLAPRVAAKLRVPIVADVTGIRVDGGALVVKHPMYIGKTIATVRMSARPAVVSIRPGAITAADNPRAERVEQLQPAGDPTAARTQVKELRAGGASKVELGEAPIIVSGGRGLKASENFRLCEELADAFGNAAVGATRAVCDDGWRPHSEQIGQTGRWVSPDLYIAVGISGAVQHLAGMKSSKTIVAINKDREAPIFKIADYGIVGDALEVVPALTAAIRKAKGQQ